MATQVAEKEPPGKLPGEFSQEERTACGRLEGHVLDAGAQASQDHAAFGAMFWGTPWGKAF